MQIMLATANTGKLREITQLMNGLPIELVTTPTEFHFPEESGETYLENAMIKAKAVADAFQTVSIGEDAGLEVDALPYMLGVRTARVIDGTDQEKNAYVLEQLQGEENRKARFRCVCVYYDPIVQESASFIGVVEGSVSETMRGEAGFGFDPIFIPDDSNPDKKTFAELGTEFKLTVSHRARAWNQCKLWIEKRLKG